MQISHNTKNSAPALSLGVTRSLGAILAHILAGARVFHLLILLIALLQQSSTAVTEQFVQTDLQLKGWQTQALEGFLVFFPV